MMTETTPRSEEYRAKASAELAAGAASTLEQVRAKHERAAQVWSELAAQEEARALDRATRLARNT